MPTFTISAASAIHCKIETGVGTINEGAIVPHNDLYTPGENICGIFYPDFAQCYQCDEVIELQIYFDDGANVPYLLIFDSDGAAVAAVVGVSVSTTEYWNFTIDFADVPCDGCYHFEIHSVTESGSNIFTDADNGTFEANINNIITGTENAIVRSSIQARTGTWSGHTTNGGTGATDANKAIESVSTYTLTSGEIYEAKAYVFIPSGTPFIVGGSDFIEIDILGEFNDAIEISKTVAKQSDGTNMWLEISSVFYVQGDNKGLIRIQADSLGSVVLSPPGQLFIDDITLGLWSSTKEGEYERIEVVADCECMPTVNYYGDTDSMQANFDNNFQWTIRLPMNKISGRISAEKEVFTDSSGTRTTVYSQSSDLSTWAIGDLPEYMVRILSLAIEHDIFKVNGIEYVSEEGYDPNVISGYGAASGELELILKDFNYLNNNC